MAETMKAWQYTSVTGGMEKNLQIIDNAPKPVPGDDEILVQVHAMAINPVDHKVTEVAPLRLLGSKFIPGADFCGKVAGVGKKVDEFKIGEMVFGAKIAELRNGTLAQYVTVRKDLAASLPSNVSHEDGAAIGIVGITEIQAIKPNVQTGDKVFINGAQAVLALTVSKLQKHLAAT